MLYYRIPGLKTGTDIIVNGHYTTLFIVDKPEEIKETIMASILTKYASEDEWDKLLSNLPLWNNRGNKPNARYIGSCAHNSNISYVATKANDSIYIYVIATFYLRGVDENSFFVINRETHNHLGYLSKNNWRYFSLYKGEKKLIKCDKATDEIEFGEIESSEEMIEVNKALESFLPSLKIRCFEIVWEIYVIDSLI